MILLRNRSNHLLKIAQNLKGWRRQVWLVLMLHNILEVAEGVLQSIAGDGEDGTFWWKNALHIFKHSYFLWKYSLHNQSFPDTSYLHLLSTQWWTFIGDSSWGPQSCKDASVGDYSGDIRHLRGSSTTTECYK